MELKREIYHVKNRTDYRHSRSRREFGQSGFNLPGGNSHPATRFFLRRGNFVSQRRMEIVSGLLALRVPLSEFFGARHWAEHLRDLLTKGAAGSNKISSSFFNYGQYFFQPNLAHEDSWPVGRADSRRHIDLGSMALASAPTA